MRFNLGGVLAALAIAALLAATPARADDTSSPSASSPDASAPSAAQNAPQSAPAGNPQGDSQSSPQDKSPTCDIPAHLLATDSALTKVADVVKNSQPLNILVVGSRSSTINTSEASAYPARLQDTLKEKLPAVAVNVSVELRPKKTAEEMAAELPKLMEDKKPTLVIWQTGTVDAMRSIDPDDFRSAVDEGIAALQKAGTDVILMNLQYSPRTETMISASPYLDTMRVVAQQYDVPLFDRFAIMQQWNDSGDFDLFSASHGLDLAKRVHDCLGRALSVFVLDAARINTAQQN
jgi:lysophospholipase L1-like esterase